jgi:lysophospholipase L1-like esterase
MKRLHIPLGLSIALALVARLAGAQVADPDPARFASEIRAFEELDRRNTAPAQAVLFVGSSTIRLWPTADRFPHLTVINRGFGGSHISDVNHFIDQTVLKYAARVVVLYAGDNDIGADKTPSSVLADYQAFVRRVHAATPDADIVFLAVKPSLARWHLWQNARAFNDLVRAYSATQPRLHFVDMAPQMLGADGRPRPELFMEDGLHMSTQGYDIWTDLLTRTLARLLAPKP